jgi:hypothetical protein
MLKIAASALRDCAQGGKEDVVPMQEAALGKGVVDTQGGFATADGQDLYLSASEVIAGKRIDRRIHDGVPLCVAALPSTPIQSSRRIRYDDIGKIITVISCDAPPVDT